MILHFRRRFLMKDGDFWRSLPQQQWGEPLSVFLRDMGVWGMQQMSVCLSVCCSSTLSSVTTGLCPIPLISFILAPYSHKSNSAFPPEVPSAPLVQSRVTAALQLWQTGSNEILQPQESGKRKMFCLYPPLWLWEMWELGGVGSSQLYCLNIWNRAPHK